ncbi:phospholipase C [Mucilaginibacter yixingensis]|uniref:phospholipase C n=1 Tax=Mucilaginibacter yixingensis TaxID=1295612 RepID=A0A2T5J4P6_9SPHI|nr:phospholipase C, phosphocholine-specific [Mucilaginibacter yixingensis]PTQ92640.1 phospholipase C [Mucilaginibacter yixingensis]
MESRRDFIKKAALLTGAAGLAGVMPAAIAKALAINAAEGSTYLDAEHVVLLMQENRSFDHCFGTLRGVRGYNDPRAIRLANQNPVWLQSNKEGQTYAPFRLDIKNTKATWMHSLPHSWANQVNAHNDGKHDKWLDEKHSSTPEYSHMPLTMGYHNREDIPFYYAFADAFTVCDQHFCSSLTGTNPNRLYFWTGSVRNQLDENARAHVWNEDMDYGTLNWPTFPERLEAAGISWKCYQNEMSIDVGFEGEEDPWLSNFQDNPLEFFGQYNIHLHPKHQAQLRKQQAELPAQIATLKQKLAAQPAGDEATVLQKQLQDKEKQLTDVNQKLADAAKRPFSSLSAHEQNLHKKAFDTNLNDPDYHQLTELSYDDAGQTRKMQVPKGDVLHQFRQDVKNGQLPTVSWLSSPENFSDHPSAPWYGAWYVSEVLDILTQNPDVWKKTIFILTYDENDGYFDHVPPFTAPHPHKTGTGKASEGIDTRPDFVTWEQENERHDFPEKYSRESSIGLGFRVPMVIASPWSKGGWVNSEVFDHTSTLQFLEKFLSHKTGKTVAEPNISDWRRTICGDLSSAFRNQDQQKAANPEFLNKDIFIPGIHKAKFKELPSAYKNFTAEEQQQIRQVQDVNYLPQQEQGVRPSCALPYELYVDGNLSADKKAFNISFKNGKDIFGSKTAGVPFNIYAMGNYQSQADAAKSDPLRTWAYAVKPGDTLNDQWPLDAFETKQYHLRAYGPNGFYREFKGDASNPQVEATVAYERNRISKNQLTGNLVISIKNNDSRPHTVTLTDNAYKTGSKQQTLAAGASANIALPLEKSFGWYDVSLKVNGAELFEQRYAGRVETGKHSQSDPLMGRTV